MSITNAYAGIMTKDIAATITWYKKLLERPFDKKQMETLYEWNFPDGGVLQLVQDEERTGRSSITLMISSRDDQINKLQEKNIPVGPTTETEYVKTVTINDPEGNRITFAENLV